MRIALMALVLASSTPALAQFKCVAPGGAVSLQQTPCPAGAASQALRVPPRAAPVKEWSTAGVKVGMPLAEVYVVAGRLPDRENLSTTAAGAQRQMIFEDRHAQVYVYAVDDVVTAIQRIRR